MLCDGAALHPATVAAQSAAANGNGAVFTKDRGRETRIAAVRITLRMPRLLPEPRFWRKLLVTPTRAPFVRHATPVGEHRIASFPWKSHQRLGLSKGSQSRAGLEQTRKVRFYCALVSAPAPWYRSDGVLRPCRNESGFLDIQWADCGQHRHACCVTILG
jgi:hypothetical protein